MGSIFGWVTLCDNSKQQGEAQRHYRSSVIKATVLKQFSDYTHLLHQSPEESLCVSSVCLLRTITEALIHQICFLCSQILMSVRPRCITASPTHYVSTCRAAIAVTVCQASSEWTNTPAPVCLHGTILLILHIMLHNDPHTHMHSKEIIIKIIERYDFFFFSSLLSTF